MRIVLSSIWLILLNFSVYTQSAYYVKNYYQQITPSFNSIGQTGLIHLPSASLQDEGNIGITFANGSSNKLLSVIVSPFSWLEASFFYNRPRDTFYIKKNKYLDKGFNAKIGFSYKNIDFAIGADDFAGTGFLSKEFIVASINAKNYIITFGAGTGALAQDKVYNNPISSFEDRPIPLFIPGDTGGEIDFNTLFKGPVGLFGGIEYFSSRYPNLRIKIETNPYDYELFLTGGSATSKSKIRRKKNKDFNYGIYYKFKNDYSISLSRIKGNAFDISFTKKFNFSKKIRHVKPKKVLLNSGSKDKKLSFYQNVLRNLEVDNLYLQSAKKNDLYVSIVNNKYNNPIKVFKHTQIVTSDIAALQDIRLHNLIVTNINSGMETGKISGKANNKLNPNKIGYIKLEEPSNDTQDYDFQTVLTFPEFYNTIKPEFIYRYADPTRFFAGGMDLKLNSEIKFRPNLYISTSISYQILNSFKRLRYYPDSPYTPNVRTDISKYLNNRPEFYLNNFQINKLTKLKNNHYIKLSTGMYEMMFGGYGIEYLWKPFNSGFSFGLNAYQVKQRDFKQRLGFLDYKVVTGHSNFIYFHSKTGISLDLSVGQYLAGDRGYTFDISRHFKNGLKMGAYFTRTNLSKIEYGEGSFDKGFYFDIPLNIFDVNSNKGKSYFHIQPLTRDGGAKLKVDNPLIYSIISGAISDYEFYNN